MTDDELKSYAEDLILEHAVSMDRMAVHDMINDLTVYTEISDEDVDKVLEWINRAYIRVTF